MYSKFHSICIITNVLISVVEIKNYLSYEAIINVSGELKSNKFNSNRNIYKSMIIYIYFGFLEMSLKWLMWVRVSVSDCLCSMDLHPSREMVASGQRAGRNRKTQAHIRIWSTETLLTLYIFGMGEFDIGVSAVAFSQLVGQVHGSQQSLCTILPIAGHLDMNELISYLIPN